MGTNGSEIQMFEGKLKEQWDKDNGKNWKEKKVVGGGILTHDS